jgi:Flp pilus assembly protein TadD
MAVDVLRRAIGQNPLDRDAILQITYLQIEQKNFADALEVLEPLLKTTPNDVRALNNHGLALRGLKRLDEARRAFKRASRLASDDPLVLTNLGAVLVELGRATEGRTLHENALRALPGDPRLLANYGACLAVLGDRDRARETLDAALAADPANEVALVARAELGA